MNQTPLPSIRIIAVAAALLFSPFLAQAQYTPDPRDYAAHRFLMDDGTGSGFFGIIRLSGVLTNHIYYDFPTNASGSFIFSNSSGGQTIAGGLAVTGGLTADMLSLTTPLAATSGGTGFSSYAVGDMLYANTTSTLTRLGIGANGLILTVSGGVPTWSNMANGLLVPFNQITNGTNTGQANLEVGAGSSLYPVGTGAITANRFVTSSSATDAVDLGTSEVSGVLPDGNVSNTLTITAGSIDGTPVGATTRSTGAFTTLDANSAVTLGNGNDNITLNAGSGIISASGDKLENVADPTAAQDAATKNYVDNGFVRLGPNPAQAYTGIRPLIRLDETGASAPSLMDLRVAGVPQLTVTNAGALTATSIQNTPIGTTTRNVGNFTDVDANGNVTLGNAAGDVITVNGTTTFATAVTGNGSITGNGAVTLGNGNDNITLNAGSGIISASGDKLENVANPTAAQDAATKTYVDNTALGGVVGPFVQLGPAALQPYSGTQPLIRLDETGAGAPNLMDLRVGGVAQLTLTNAGALTATSIQNTPIGTTTRNVGNFTDVDANGNVTLGNAVADVITVNGTTTFATAVTGNGAVTLGNGNDNITLNAGSGIISASGDKLENVADPTAAQDAATKNYVDNGFVRLGPPALQAYSGTQPLIRLDETGAGAPNLMDLRVGGVAQLTLTNAGALTATSIQNTPIGTTTRNVGNFTDVDANGNVTLGNAVADVITVNGTTTFATAVTGNGAVTLGNGNDNITLNAGSGIISASGDKLENVADPTAAQDAATKNYVDNGFVRLGPPALQAYSGTQPLIRLDETGAGAPNLMDLRVGGVAQLTLTNAGALTATSIQNTPIGTTTRNVGNFTDVDANGNVTLGNAVGDVITVNGTTTFANAVTGNGAITGNGAVTLGNGNDNITLNAGSGIISASGDKLENVADPTAAQDAATKNYVDNGFVRLGPPALQSYSGTQPLIRLDETGAGAPNLMDLRVGGVAQLTLSNAGALTATSIQNTPIGTTTRNVGNFTDVDANGNVTLGNAVGDVITVNGTTTFANGVTGNGAVTLGNGNDNITLNAGSGIISASGDKLENVADPTAAQDAATKTYVDNTALGGFVGPFVQLGPAALQSYSGTQPLIRLDETGAGAPNLMDLRVGGVAQLTLSNAGALTAISIQNTPIGTTTRNVGNFTDVDANGNVTLGNAVADVITVNGTTTFANAVTGNGAVTLGNGNDNITLNAGSGIISASGDKLENVADPTAAQDAATKNYVDNGFVRLGPPALQSYSGTQPLIRLDETGAGAPNLMDLRVAGVATFGVTNNGTIRVGTTTSSTNSRMTIRDGHLQSQQTTAPTTGTLGTGVVSAVLTNATDVAGIITIATNATPATGAQATVTFNLPYGIAPIVVLTPANGNASGIVNHATRTAAGFTVNFNAAPAASTSYQFYYHVIETQ